MSGLDDQGGRLHAAGEADSAGQLALLELAERDPSPDALADVLTLTRDPSPVVRAEALRVASVIGGPDAIKAMCVLLWADADESVGQAAAAGLARVLDAAAGSGANDNAPDIILAVGLLSPERAAAVQPELEAIARQIRHVLVDQIQAEDDTIRTGARRLLHTVVRRLAEQTESPSIDDPADEALAPPEPDVAIAPRRADPHEDPDLVSDELEAPQPPTDAPGHASVQEHTRTNEGQEVRGSREQVAAVMPDLIGQLVEGAGVARASVADAIGALPSTKVRAWIIEQLQTRGPDVEAVAMATALLGFDDLLHAVAELLLAHSELGSSDDLMAVLRDRPAMWQVVEEMQRAPRPSRRLHGLELAETLDPGRIEPVLVALADPAAAVRSQAVRSLPPTPPEPVTERLLAMIDADSSAAVRLHLVHTLARASRDVRLEAARRAIASADPAIRTAALGLVRTRGGEELAILARALDDPVTSIVAETARTLARHHAPESLSVLWRALREADANRRPAVIAGTLELGADVLAATAIHAIDSNDPAERVAGLAVLTAMPDPGVDPVELIHDALVDPAPNVRREALASLRSHPDWIHVDEVGDRVSDADLDVRLLALSVLDTSENDAAVPYLLDAMRDPDGAIREQARAILVSRRSTTLASRLVEALADPQKAQVASSLLVELADASFTPLLRAVEESGDEARRIIGQTLRDGGHEALVLETLGDRRPELRRQAIEAIGAMATGRSATVPEQLSDRLADPVPSVRATAARVMGEIGDHAILSALLAHRDEDPDPGVRRAIANALALLGHDDLEPVLDLDELADDDT